MQVTSRLMKMANITQNEGNAKENYSEILHEDGYYKNKAEKKCR